jgi:hypothetical protein
MFLRGVLLDLFKTGSPDELTITVFSGTTELGHIHIPAASIISTVSMYCYFSTPIELTPDVMNYIILSQTGTSNSHDYDIRQMTVNANYIGTAQDDNFRMVYGTSADPTALTVSQIECPSLFPIITDLATDLDTLNISDAYLTVAEAPTGKKFYAVSGGVKTGTGTKTLSAANDTVAAGYYAATTLSAVDADLAAANIAVGTTIFGFVGAAAGGGGAINLDKMGAM